LATDINTRALEMAVAGNFGAWSARSVPECHARQMTLRSDGVRNFCAEVRERITFANHNLLEPAPRSARAHGGWDLIVCRNVLIYFGRSQAQRVLAQLKGALAPEGLLVLGASDIVLELPSGLRTVDVRGRLAFRRRGPSLDLLCPEEHMPLCKGKDSASDRDPLALSPARALDTGPDHVRNESSEHFCSDDTDSGIEEMLEGILRYLSGELNAAAQCLREALFHCAQLWPAAYYLALCYDELGRGVEAKREYQRTADLIARRVVLPYVPNHDFSFLERDIRGLAQRRAAARAK